MLRTVRHDTGWWWPTRRWSAFDARTVGVAYDGPGLERLHVSVQPGAGTSHAASALLLRHHALIVRLLLFQRPRDTVVPSVAHVGQHHARGVAWHVANHEPPVPGVVDGARPEAHTRHQRTCRSQRSNAVVISRVHVDDTRTVFKWHGWKADTQLRHVYNAAHRWPVLVQQHDQRRQAVFPHAHVRVAVSTPLLPRPRERLAAVIERLDGLVRSLWHHERLALHPPRRWRWRWRWRRSTAAPACTGTSLAEACG